MTVTAADPRGVVGGDRYGLRAGDAYGDRRARGGVAKDRVAVARRTGDRVGDRLEMRTRRGGVAGSSPPERSVMLVAPRELLAAAALICPQIARCFGGSRLP